MIPGTKVPETPVHRASLWLEDVKYPGRREDPQVEGLENETLERFIAGTGINATPEQLIEASGYYGKNLLVMTFPLLGLVVITPEIVQALADVTSSAWLDGFMHGAATQAGKHGLSNEEEGRGQPD